MSKKKFDIVLARCDRYEVEADNAEAALQQITDSYYSERNFKRKWDDQLVDFFTKFENEGEVERDDEEGEGDQNAL